MQSFVIRSSRPHGPSPGLHVFIDGVLPFNARQLVKALNERVQILTIGGTGLFVYPYGENV
jgi:hypothetical protein